ncbi:MAG: uroporphyrinogen-III synthase [Porticoccaceae bacterium]
MTISLAGLRVLILRSARPGDPLAARLMAKGADVHSFPLLGIEPRPALDADLAVTVANADGWIFVSRHAVRHGLEQVAAASLLPTRVPIFAVGAATAAALREDWSIAARHPSEANTEGLLGLPELQEVRGRTLVIFRGAGGRDALRAGLRARGARVHYCEVYRRVPERRWEPELSMALAAPSPLLLVAHSGEVLRALRAVVDRARESEDRSIALPVCLVPGERVAGIARGLGFEPLIAASALAAKMEQAVCRWYTPGRIEA